MTGKAIESRQIADYVGHQAASGENVMREVSTLMNTQKGPGFKDQVFQDMVKLQGQGKLPGLELTDSSGKPVTNPSDAGNIKTIKSTKTGQVVYRTGDFHLQTADRQDTLRDMPGFTDVYKDQRRNPFDVAREQAEQQRRITADTRNRPAETTMTEQEKTQKAQFQKCFDSMAGSDFKLSHRMIECSAETGYKPPGVKMDNIPVERIRQH